MTRALSGHNVSLSLSPDELDTLVQALRGLQPSVSDEIRDTLLYRVRMAYDASQGNA